MSCTPFRITLRCLIQIRECFVVLFISQQHIAAAPARLGIVRRARNGFIKRLQRTDRVAELIANETQF